MKLPSRWDTLSEHLHASCKVFDVYKRTCQHPGDGRKGDFYVIKSPGWVQVLALTDKKELILVCQYRFGVDSLSWETPGGVLDYGEEPITGALRELEEETGYVGEEARLIATSAPNPAIQTNYTYFVLVKNCRKQKEISWDEHEELLTRVIPVNEAFEMVRHHQIYHSIAINALYYLREIMDGKL